MSVPNCPNCEKPMKVYKAIDRMQFFSCDCQVKDSDKLNMVAIPINESSLT